MRVELVSGAFSRELVDAVLCRVSRVGEESKGADIIISDRANKFFASVNPVRDCQVIGNVVYCSSLRTFFSLALLNLQFQ